MGRGYGSGRKGRAGARMHADPFHSAHVVPPEGYKPFRDRKVPTKHTVDCPTCGATIGSPCVNLTTGAEIQSCHPSRRRMAIRLENRLREEAAQADETREG